MTNLVNGNRAMRNRDYDAAVRFYRQGVHGVKEKTPIWKVLIFNLDLALRKNSSQQLKTIQSAPNENINDLADSKNLDAIHTIKSSRFFDAKWCNKTFPVETYSPIELAKYYLDKGWKLGYDPSPDFSTLEYLKRNPDVAKASVNPLLHYEKHGKNEKRGLLIGAKLIFPEKCKRLLNRRILPQDWDQSREDRFIQGMISYGSSIENTCVSIIMPTWNRVACVGDAIESVLNQSHKNWELIIVDDGSTDTTRDRVNSYADNRIRYIEHGSRKGVSAARNTGLKHAQGSWIFFLDSDNKWRPHFLTTMLQFVTKSGVDAAYCGANLVKDDFDKNVILFSDFEFESCASENFIDLNTFCVNSTLVHIGFNESLRRFVDWDFMLQVATRGCIRAAPFIGVDYYDGDRNSRITRTEYRRKEEFNAIRESITNRALLSLTEKPVLGVTHRARIAVVFHVYHTEHIAECIEHLKKIEHPFHLYITTSYSPSDTALKAISEIFEDTVILQYPNVGKDVAPFLELLSTLLNYDVVCKIHTKRDVPPTGPIWREHSLRCLLGNTENINEIIRASFGEQGIKLIGPKAFYKSGRKSIPETLDKIAWTVQEMGLSEELSQENWGYFAGTMFWVKPRILLGLSRYFCDHALYSSVYMVDGQFEHAIERLIGFLGADKNGEKNIRLVDIRINGETKLLSPRSALSHYELPITKTLEELSQQYRRAPPIGEEISGTVSKKSNSVNKGGLSDPNNSIRKLRFFPDYRANNPYQELLYREMPGFSAYPGSIENCLNDIRSSSSASNNKESDTSVLHLHWLHPIVNNAETVQEARECVDKFLGKAKFFVLSGGRILWTVHNVISHEPRYLGEEIRLTQGVIELADWIHVHHAAVAEFCQPYYTLPLDKTVIAEHGNYIGTYPGSVDRARSREELKIPLNATVFLFLGQLRVYKGIDDLLSAFRELVMQESESYLVLAGKVLGVDEKYLADRIAGIRNTIFKPGYVADERMQSYLKSADVMVLPYKKVLTSGSVFLAMSSGLPIICPNSGLLTHTVLDQQNGILYDADDPYGLLTAMKEFVGKPSAEKLAMGKNSFGIAERYSWKETGRKLSLFLGGRAFGRVIKTKLGADERTWFVRGDINSLKGKECIAIIVHYQNIYDTFECIDQLQAQQADIGIVVISNSEWITDARSVAGQFPEIVIVQSENNIGYAAANNFGLWLCRLLRPAFFWLLNPDIIVPKNYYRDIMEEIESFPLACFFGSTIVHAESNAVLFCGGDVSIKDGARPSHRFIGRQLRDIPREPFSCDYLTGANILARSLVLDSAGYLPEHYFLYFEETDWFLSQKLADNQRPVIFPNLVVKNRKRSEIGGLPAKHYVYYFIRNALLFGKKFAGVHMVACECETRKFADAWLEKIKKNAPDSLETFEELVGLAFRDGFEGLTGPTLAAGQGNAKGFRLGVDRA